MITGALTFALPCRLFGVFSILMHPSVFSFSLLQFCDCFILFLCYFSSVISLYVILILCHRKLAYAAVEPLSIYAFIFSPHASLKYLIPPSFLHPVLLKSSFPQVLDRWLPCNLSLSWCCTHKTETLIKHLIWRSNGFSEDKCASLHLQPVHASQGTTHLYSSSSSPDRWDVWINASAKRLQDNVSHNFIMQPPRDQWQHFG